MRYKRHTYRMELVLPKWLDDIEGVDFTPEKDLLRQLESWAQEDGWIVSDGSVLPEELGRRTDVLLAQPQKKQHLRLAVLPKRKRGSGAIRIDASTHRIFDLMYQPQKKQWRVETAAVPLSDDLQKEGWRWLANLAFRP